MHYSKRAKAIGKKFQEVSWTKLLRNAKVITKTSTWTIMMSFPTFPSWSVIVMISPSFLHQEIFQPMYRGLWKLPTYIKSSQVLIFVFLELVPPLSLCSFQSFPIIIFLKKAYAENFYVKSKSSTLSSASSLVPKWFKLLRLKSTFFSRLQRSSRRFWLGKR